MRFMGLFNLRNLLLIALLIFGFQYYRSSKEIDVQSLSAPMDTKILTFGDSLTQGYGVAQNKSYPSQLSDLLHASVVNESIVGELSAQGRARLPGVLERVKPDILVLCHGANDILQHKDLFKTEENLDAMVKLAKDKGIFVILIGVPTYDILQYNVAEFYYNIARQNDVKLEDESLKSIMNDIALRSDAVHPNEKGYTLIAQKVAQIITDAYTSR